MPEALQRQQSLHKDHFLQLMFFQPSRPESGAEPVPPEPRPLADPHAPLHRFVARPGVRYALPAPTSAPPVRVDSPALAVMTDLRKVVPATIDADATVDMANRLMIDRGVRALFVTAGRAHHVAGVVTATDVLGERPILAAHRQAMRSGDVPVRDVMTPADALEVLDLHDVERAHVGNIVATLQHAGRQHALAVEPGRGAGDAGALAVCGIFSLTQIARQLGVPPGPAQDIAQTFAEIEKVVGG